MACITGAGPVRAFPDIVDRRIPVIGESIEFFHANSRLLKGIPDSRDDTKGRDLLPVPGTLPQDETWLRLGTRSFMAIIAVPILAARMAPIAAHLTPVNAVGFLCQQCLRVDRLMAVRAGGTVLHRLLREILIAVSVKFPLLVTVEAHHSFLVMDIRRPAVLARILGINASTMAEGAGLAFIFLYKLMPLDQTETNPGDRR